jgi:YjbE family integral membrane protein
MDFLSAPWWSALLAIVLIDLVLAGDNAIVIALAARSLPPHLQRRAIVWGSVGAIVVRAAMTIGVVWLLKIPGLMLVGGIGLVWIAYRLLVDQDAREEHGAAASTFWGAMKTIVVADALMGIDNVLGVAGAAHGAWDLVLIGLVVSVPIVVFGSSVVLKVVERFPVIIQAGAAVLAFTAAKMIASEPLLATVFDAQALRWALYGSLVAPHDERLNDAAAVLSCGDDQAADQVAAERCGLAARRDALRRGRGAHLRRRLDRLVRDRVVQRGGPAGPGVADVSGHGPDARPVPVRDQRLDVLGRGRRAGGLPCPRLRGGADRLAPVFAARRRDRVSARASVREAVTPLPVCACR